MFEVPSIWREKLGSITETVISKQSDIDSPLMQHCTVRHDASRGDELRQLVTHAQCENVYNESSI